MSNNNVKKIIEFRFGRNLHTSGVEMCFEEWEQFIYEAKRRMQSAPAMFLGLATERPGYWVECHVSNDGYYNGVVEGSGVVTLFIDAFDEDSDFSAALFGQLCLDAAAMARSFDQDAVAVVWAGVGHLIGKGGEVR